MPMDAEFAFVVAHLLWRHQAIQVREEEPFRLASGNFAPFYIDCRCLISFPASRDIIVGFAQYLSHERDMKADCVAGGETAGIPFGAWLAQRLNKPFVYVRKKRKDYGTGTCVEGRPAGRILLFEDLITDGGSKTGFVEAIREAGCAISDCLVVMDRQAGGAECLKKLGVTLHALTTLSTCLEVGREREFLSPQAHAHINEYLADSRAWHRRRDLHFTEIGEQK